MFPYQVLGMVYTVFTFWAGVGRVWLDIVDVVDNQDHVKPMLGAILMGSASVYCGLHMDLWITQSAPYIQKRALEDDPLLYVIGLIL